MPSDRDQNDHEHKHPFSDGVPPEPPPYGKMPPVVQKYIRAGAVTGCSFSDENACDGVTCAYHRKKDAPKHKLFADEREQGGEDRKGNWIVTSSGKQFYIFDPKPEMVDIGDIGHALALLCRWGGHTTHFYSVAEHSVRVARIVPLEHQLAALVHDAHEAYTLDVPRPIKRGLADYGPMADKIQEVILAALEIEVSDEAHKAIKYADNILLMTEARDVTTHPFEGVNWVPGHDERTADDMPAPLCEHILAMPWKIAKAEFLTLWARLSGERLRRW